MTTKLLVMRDVANRELIARFEQKIQATLARIWGENTAESFGENA